MAIKIYWNEKTIFLSEKETEISYLFPKETEPVIFEVSIESDIKKAVDEIKIATKKDFIITCEDIDFLKTLFFNIFHVIEAAGGLVINNKKEILFIFRRGKWDLPKGKMEAGESPEFCAEREIEEETGVDQLKLINKIIDTYHIYEERGVQILKKTYWFYFTTSFEGTAKPQTEEDITGISWINKENLDTPLADTFDSIMDVIDKGAPIF